MRASATVSSKGQVVLPISIRKAIRVEKGDLLLMEVVGGKIVLKPAQKFLGQEAKEEKKRLLRETMGSLSSLDPRYVDELRASAAKKLDDNWP